MAASDEDYSGEDESPLENDSERNSDVERMPSRPLADTTEGQDYLKQVCGEEFQLKKRKRRRMETVTKNVIQNAEAEQARHQKEMELRRDDEIVEGSFELFEPREVKTLIGHPFSKPNKN